MIILAALGTPHLDTPNFDRVAAMGVRFTQTYVQSPICGASRMCYYTGHYASSHGAQCNGFLLGVGKQTIEGHLRKLGINSWIIVKTHMKAVVQGIARHVLAADSVIGARKSECGFGNWVRDDCLWG